MRFIIAALMVALPTPIQAQSLDCRRYAETVRPIIKPRVEALRLVEREAADRLKGLDTRTFPYLVGEARKTADLIADSKALETEQELDKCRNSVPAVRRTCHGAALALASALEQHEAAGSVSKEARQAYADVMPGCERMMGLQPLSTAWRTLD